MRVFVVVLALVVLIPVAAVVVSMNRSTPPAGLTRQQATTAAERELRCPGRPTPKVVRCTARDDLWECEYRSSPGQGGTVTLGGGYVTGPIC